MSQQRRLLVRWETTIVVVVGAVVIARVEILSGDRHLALHWS